MDQPTRILVIDDDESIRKTVSAILEENDYTVETAENGKTALRKLKEKTFDLALIDVRLPDIEGTKLLAKIEVISPKTAKIIVTGYPALQNAIEAVNKGADVYLIKPVNIDNLLGTISEQIERRRRQEKFDELMIAQFLETRVKEIERDRPTSCRQDP
jgi:DNA-binding NtrC family response regulator